MRPTHRGQLQPGGLKSVAVRGLGMHPTSYTGIYIQGEPESTDPFNLLIEEKLRTL